jgi:hypothetical protein
MARASGSLWDPMAPPRPSVFDIEVDTTVQQPIRNIDLSPRKHFTPRIHLNRSLFLPAVPLFARDVHAMPCIET